MTPDRTLCQKPGEPGRIAGSKGETCAAPTRDEALLVGREPEGSGREDLLQRSRRGNASGPTREARVLMD